MGDADYSRFEEFINGFTDEEFDDWVNGDDTTWKDTNVDGATNKQAEFARTLRDAPSDSQMEELEAEQTFEQPSRVVEVYDNRDLPPIRRNFTIEQYYGQPPIIIPQTPIEESRIVLPRAGQAPTLPKPIIQPQRTTIRQRFASFSSRITGLFRRRKQ